MWTHRTKRTRPTPTCTRLPRTTRRHCGTRQPPPTRCLGPTARPPAAVTRPQSRGRPWPCRRTRRRPAPCCAGPERRSPSCPMRTLRPRPWPRSCAASHMPPAMGRRKTQRTRHTSARCQRQQRTAQLHACKQRTDRTPAGSCVASGSGVADFLPSAAAPDAAPSPSCLLASEPHTNNEPGARAMGGGAGVDGAAVHMARVDVPTGGPHVGVAAASMRREGTRVPAWRPQVP